MTHLRPIAVLVLFASLYCTGRAAAEPRLRSRGFYADAAAGAAGIIGSHQSHANWGPLFGVRVGGDLLPWFSLGGRLELSTHEAVVPPPPEDEYFQFYTVAVDGRLSAPLGRFELFADGGLGITWVSTNVLSKVAVLAPGESFTPSLSAGGGIEYQLHNRHFAVGLAGQWSLLPAFDASQTASARTYLRYTY